MRVADRVAGTDAEAAVDGAGAGIGAPVSRATELLTEVLVILDPARLTGGDAAVLYRMFAAVERLSMAGKTLLAPRIDESGVWRDGGHRSPAVMLAELEGVPTGQARNTLEVGRRLPELPGTEEALRSGSLSGPKVAELSGAALLDPGSEDALLCGAAEQPLQLIKERCQRARSTAGQADPVAAVRRIHASRFFSSWTDPDGAFCYRGRDTADRGARILEQMQHTVGRIRAAQKPEGSNRTPVAGATAERVPIDSDLALRADAFFLLLTGRTEVGRGAGRSDGGRPEPGPDLVPEDGTGWAGDPGDDDPGPAQVPTAVEVGNRNGMTRVLGEGSASPPVGPGSEPPPGVRPGSDPMTGDSDVNDIIERPPTCSVMVRVDLDALLNGRTMPGELCEIDNQGPIPVAMARDLANDSFLRLVFHQAGDIRAVSHFGRTVNRVLRTALAFRDRCCVVPGCGVAFGLEIDHVIPFAEGGPTELDNLALLCHHHHFLKTYEGWTLERAGRGDDGSPSWVFTPLPPFGEEPDPLEL